MATTVVSIAALLLAATPAAAADATAAGPAPATGLFDTDCGPEALLAAGSAAEDPARLELADAICSPQETTAAEAPPVEVTPAGDAGADAVDPELAAAEPAETTPDATPDAVDVQARESERASRAADRRRRAERTARERRARQRHVARARAEQRQALLRRRDSRERKRERMRARARARRARTLAAAGAAAPQPHGAAGGDVALPALLMPIYRAAGAEHGVDWETLAAINEIETGFGRNLNVSSAGAVGWMQFMPATWDAYGVDADGDGRADPYDPRDAIFSAARYLAAAGYSSDVRGAIFAYNHADWYVDRVLLRAGMIADGHKLLKDPLPRARRLARDFAQRLRRISERHDLDWALVLAVLRIRDDARGRRPATGAELRSLARRLEALRADRNPRRALRRMARRRHARSPIRQATFARRVTALGHYHRAVGITGLTRGLEAVRERLTRRVLRNDHLSIYSGGREDVRHGAIDVRVLVLLRYLARSYDDVAVTSLTTGHSILTASGNVSAHSYGSAVDIAALDGTPIAGHQESGGLTERALHRILMLPRRLRPRQLISLFELGGPAFALADHDDHIHVGY